MTKKKSIWALALAIFMFVPAMFLLTACGHTHSFNTEEWESDETSHWHAATCKHTDEKIDIADHTWGDWTIKTYPDYGKAGEKEHQCIVCEYIATEPISALDAKENTISVDEEDLLGIIYNAKPQPINDSVSASYTAGMEIKYKGTGDTTYAESTTAPTDAGTYEYTITIPATAEWKEAQTTGRFTIKKYTVRCPEVFVTYLRNGQTTTNVLCEIDLSEDDNIESEEVVNLIYNNGENSNYGVGRMNILAKKIKIDNSNFTLSNVPTGNNATIEWIVADKNDRFGFRVTEVEDAGSCYVGTIQHGCVEVCDKLTIIGTNTTGSLVKTNVTISSIEYWNTSDISNQKYVKTDIATVKRENSLTESGKVKISFTKDDASAVLPSTVNYVVEMQDMGTINQHQKSKTTTELSYDGNEYRVFKLNIDTTNTIKLTLTNPDTCSFKVLNASTGAEITLENNKFQLENSADILIVIKQSTSKGSHQLTVESIEYSFGA